jgi:rod shape-determining protein MreB
MSETIYLGIDLGTSRTSITTSNGVRETVWSYVGYPKDHVAKKKMGGRDIIYGKEAVDNRMSLNLLRPLAGGSIKAKGSQDSSETKKAVRDLLEYVVSLAKAPAGSTIYSVIGAPAEASVEGKAAILEAASNCIDSVIVCSEPFAVAYGLDFLDDTLATFIKETYPDAQFSINMVRAYKEKFSSVSTKMDEAQVTMPVAGKPTEFDITELVYKACYTIIPPTVEALQDLIATYDPEFQAKMRANILLGGGGSQIKGLGLAIEAALEEYGGGKVTTVEEAQYAGSNGALKIALDMPLEFWKEFQGGAAAEEAAE